MLAVGSYVVRASCDAEDAVVAVQLQGTTYGSRAMCA